jgi:hypothetical protein
VVGITGMDEAAPTQESLPALRTALLGFYDDHTSVIGHHPVRTRRERLMSQGVARLRLKGLLIVVALVVGAVRTMRGDTSMFGDVRPLAQRYGRLAGKDPDVARAEVLRIVRQLLPLDARMRLAGELPRQVTGAEFEQAADALLGFHGEARPG